MRKLKIMEHISLDGVIQHSADGDDFPYSDWTAPYRTPVGRDAVTAAYGEAFDLLLGRRTYEIWSGFWPKAPHSPISDGLNAATKYVVTHRPESLEWGPFEGLGPDIVESVRRIKSQDGPDIILSGSSTLTSTLLEHGLADEVILIVYPVLLGTGKRFFAERTPTRSFELLNTKAMPSGIIFTTYKTISSDRPTSSEHDQKARRSIRSHPSGPPPHSTGRRSGPHSECGRCKPREQLFSVRLHAPL